MPRFRAKFPWSRLRDALLAAAAAGAIAAFALPALASTPAVGFGQIACGDKDAAQGLCRLQVTLTDANGNVQNLAAGPANGAFTDCSGGFSTGATQIQVITSSIGTNYRFLLNPPSASESLWFNTTGGSAAVNGEASGSVELKAGASFVWSGNYIPSTALKIIATTAGHKWTCTYG